MPGDKSISHRSVIFSALASGVSTIRNYSSSNDCRSTLSCLQQLGAEVEITAEEITVNGIGTSGFREPESALDCGNSGTTFRLLLGALAGTNGFFVLTGDHSLSARPMDRVLRPLQRMGITYDGRTGGKLPPIALRGGTLSGMTYDSPVASAQVKSAILLAGLSASGETIVNEPAPSRDHTERMLRAMGADLEYRPYYIRIRPSSLRATEFLVPGDPSSAAFLLGAALLLPDSEVRVNSLCNNPTRTGFLRVLERMGACLEFAEERESSGENLVDVIARTSQLKASEIGGTEIPSLIDEIPILAVLATQAEGTTVIRDAAELRIKETDRLTALHTELTKMGARISEQADGLRIQGPVRLEGAELDPHGDHRIAMALSVAALIAGSPSTMLDSQCAGVSYPEYWSALSSLGTEVSEVVG